MQILTVLISIEIMISDHNLPAACLMCAGLFQSSTVCTAGAGCICGAVMVGDCLSYPVCLDAQNAAKKVFCIWHADQMGS